MTMIKLLLLAFLLLYILPIALALLYRAVRHRVYRSAFDRSPAGLLPPPSDPTARVRVLFNRGMRWRHALGGHSFIAYKAQGAAGYVRYDYDSQGEPLRTQGFHANDAGMGAPPYLIFAADGPAAQAMIAPIEAAVAEYGRRHVHDYKRFPGPNSNSFVQGIIDAVPGLHAVLLPTARGKDYPHDGRWLRRTHTGVHLTLGGYVGLRLGWIEGLELNIFGGVAGLDWRRPALKLPALGRIGLSPCPRPPFAPGSGRLMLPGSMAAVGARHGGQHWTDIPQPAMAGGGRRFRIQRGR